MTQVLVPVADGSEEMETVIIVDTLRRAGLDVTLAALERRRIRASRGVTLEADTVLAEVDPDAFNVLLLPGGRPGTDHFCAHAGLLAIVRAFADSGRLYGAICAAPLALQAAGVLAGKRVTCHPATAAEIMVTEPVAERVVVDGQLVTSQGPGTTFEFALTIIELVAGVDKARAVAAPMVLPG